MIDETHTSGSSSRIPTDLAVVVLLVLLTDVAVLVPPFDQTPLRLVVGPLTLLFLPGYALVSALFPRRLRSTGSSDSSGPPTDVLALSVGSSLGIVGLVGFTSNFTPWGITLVPVLAGVTGITILAATVAAVRRRSLPREERPKRVFSVRSVRSNISELRANPLWNAVLALSLLIAVASVAYAVAGPADGESFTKFYLLTENEDGDLTAEGYPTEFVRNEPKTIHVGIENHEHRPTDYTVVAKVQRVRMADESVTVVEEEEIDRFQTRLEPDEEWTDERSVAPTMVGENVRLTFLLYEGNPPSDPTVENAYQVTYLSVNVSAPDDSP